MSVYLNTPSRSHENNPRSTEPQNASDNVTMRAQMCWLLQIQYLAPSASEDTKVTLLGLAQEDTIPSNPTRNAALDAVIHAMKEFSNHPVFNPVLSDLATYALTSLGSQQSPTPIKVFSPGKAFEILPTQMRNLPKSRVARRLYF